jgi:predicted DCC family thiol-disulfide oxidoreductase YuxK
MKLTVLFDANCAFCVRSAHWLATQRAHVTLELLPAESEQAVARFGMLPWLGQQLCVVAGDGRVWAGSAAFVMCLWALVDYRELAMRVASPGLAPLAQRFFRFVSARRHRLAALVSHAPCAGAACARPLSSAYR